MARNVGSGEFQIGPSLTGFQQKLRAGLARVSASKDVTITPDFTRANAQIRAWSNLPRRDIQIGVRVDDRQMRQFQERFTRVEHVVRKSSLQRGIRVQITVAGAAALPALAQGALSAAAALTQLGQAALLLPGLFAGIGATVGTLVTGFSGLGKAFSAAGKNAGDAAANTKDFARASKDLEKAQRQMRKAVTDARREIEDQGQAVRDVFLDQEQASINVARALEALKEPSETLTDYRQKVLDVNQALSDQTRVNREAQRTANDGNAALKAGVKGTDTYMDAVDNLTAAIETFSESQKKASGFSQEFADAMAALSPNAQDLVNKVLSLKDAWAGLTRAVSDRMFAGVGDAIVDLANRRLPLLQEKMSSVAGSLNNIFKDVLGNIGNDANSGRISKIFDNVAAALDRMRPGIDSFVDGFVRLSEVGSRFLPRLGDAFSDLMARFERFTQRAEADGSLEKWINQGLHVIGQLGESILSIGSILNSVTEAYQEATGNIGGFADTMARGLGKLADYLKSPEGRKALVDYIKDAQLFLSNIQKAIPGIIDAFQTFADAARDFASVVFPIFAQIGQFMRDNQFLVGALIKMYLAYRGVIKPVFDIMRGGWERAERVAKRYQATQAEILATEKQRQAAAMAFIDNRTKSNAAEKALPALGGAALQARRDDLAAKAKVDAAQAKVDADKAAVARSYTALQAAGATRGVSTDPTKGRSSEMRAYKTALDQATRSQESLKAAEKNRIPTLSALNAANKEFDRVTNEYRTANFNAAASMDTVRAAGEKLAGPSGTFGKLKNAVGSGVGRAASGLIGSVGGLTAGLGSTALIGTAIWALTEWSAVNTEAADEVQRHREEVQGLTEALSENTGAANSVTQQKITDTLQNARNTATGQEYGNLLDVASRNGVDTNALVTALNQGDTAAVDKLLAPVRQKAAASLGDFGGFSDPGLLNNALAGDPGAIDRYKEKTNITGLSDHTQRFLERMQIADITDLKDVQDSLPQDTQQQFQLLQTTADILRNRQEATGAQQQSIYSNFGGARLKPGHPFGPGADVSAGANGAATVAISGDFAATNPGLLANIEQNGGQRGADRSDGKIEFTLDPERAKRYVEFGQFASGGHVSGPGGPRSDAVPAWLSNGEYVLNAKSAAALGKPLLDMMNGAPKFKGGGWFGDAIKKPVPPTPATIIPALGGLPKSTAPPPSGVFNIANPVAPVVTPSFGPAGPRAPIRPAPSMSRGTFDKLKEDPQLPIDLAQNELSPFNPALRAGAGSMLGRSAAPKGSARDNIIAPFNTNRGGTWGSPKPSLPFLNKVGFPALNIPAPAHPGSGGAAGPGGVKSAPGLPGPLTSIPTTHSAPSRGPGPAYTNAAPGAVSMPPNTSIPLGPGGRTGPENGLQINTVRLKRAIEQQFPEISTIGGVREDALHWHPDGLALDVMVGNTPEGHALGDRVKAWVQANGEQFGFRDFSTGESIWRDGGAHEDHLHLVTTGGGMPGPGGIPANAMAPVFDPRLGTVGIPGQPGIPVLGGQPGLGGLSIGANNEISGPFGPLPDQPGDILGSIGQIILGAIGSIFGIDLSSIMGIIQTIAGDDAVKNLMPGAAGPQNYVPSDNMAQYFGGNPKATAPEGNSPEALARYIYDSATNNGYTPTEAKAFVAQALGESQLSPSAYGGSTGDSTGGASGIFQFTPGTWASFGGGGDPLDAKANIDAYMRLAQARDPRVGDIRSRLGVNVSVGGPAHPSNDPTGEKWQRYMEQASGLLGFASGGHVTGPGGPRSDMVPAMLSNGEYVLSAKAASRIGTQNLNRLNAQRYADGGPVIPLYPPVGAAGTAAQNIFGASNPNAENAVGAAGSAAAGLFSPKGGAAGAGARAGRAAQADRAALAPGPESNDHLNPAFRGAIEGGFATAGSLAATAASMAIGAGTMGAGAGPAAGAAGAGIQAGFQMAGQVASGAANVLSSLLVGTATPASTGQGYGQSMIPQAPAPRNFQSIHNGDVTVGSMSEYTRTQERMTAQRQAGFMNRF